MLCVVSTLRLMSQYSSLWKPLFIFSSFIILLCGTLWCHPDFSKKLFKATWNHIGRISYILDGRDWSTNGCSSVYLWLLVRERVKSWRERSFLSLRLIFLTFIGGVIAEFWCGERQCQCQSSIEEATHWILMTRSIFITFGTQWRLMTCIDVIAQTVPERWEHQLQSKWYWVQFIKLIHGEVKENKVHIKITNVLSNGGGYY